ncbi:MAG: polyphosphate kinase 2 family protein [Nitrososphaerota archaeon]|jgi:PPK2 family polyphosphate:nucleotide phosphotransferase|uniref:PPK2 family polyphosphate kinase n=1 Tax=Candidatus Bathycorpusculum sp. TaxID=2994959 RepID=UPI00281E9DAD|nr:polyphosphate kinase 2 family protein [Candidatus Termitimicrobium sp.]MCL2431086.1 polyphosphate kinase 2 family protein [Candidatus Termitimicrobium sp.]MDR0492221.1 polyphosphate kinase 2 family protein [Nitrososphaerota archaeon]
MSIGAQDFKVPVGKKIRLKDHDSNWVPKWAMQEKSKKALKQHALTLLEKNRQKLISEQELLWASDTYSILIILQGMDAAGKDSTIRHVMSGVNPQGCRVTSFKTPSTEELKHNFLWRHIKALPERGSIGIFNRSYYEDVLIVKVRPEVFAKQKLPLIKDKKLFWEQRYEDITLLERHLVRGRTLVLKFYLHISKKEQKKRLLKRLDDPNKAWKFSITDLEERTKWLEYEKAYEEMLNKTSTEWAPWYIVPADRKWVAHALISEVIASEIKKLNLKYPVLSITQKEELTKAKAELEKNST